MSTTLTGESLSFRSARPTRRPATHRLAVSFLRSRHALRASLTAAAAYDAARTPAARRAALERFQAELSR